MYITFMLQQVNLEVSVCYTAQHRGFAFVPEVEY